MPRHPLTSSTAACCWIPLFALRCEEGRRPELASQPAALLAPAIARRLGQVSPDRRPAGALRRSPVRRGLGIGSSVHIFASDLPHFHDYVEQPLGFMKA